MQVTRIMPSLNALISSMSLEAMMRITTLMAASKQQTLLVNRLNITRYSQISITIASTSSKTLTLKTSTLSSMISKPIRMFLSLIYYRRSAAKRLQLILWAMMETCAQSLLRIENSIKSQKWLRRMTIVWLSIPLLC